MKEEMQKTNKVKLRSVLIPSAVIIFAIAVIFNCCRSYASGGLDDKLMKKNRAEVKALQTAVVADVESAVNALDKANEVDSTASQRIRYQRMFSSSVILGDSLTEGLTVYNWLTEATVFAQVGGSVVYGEENFQKAASTYPKYAFFAFGMNDMGNYSGDASAFIEQYTKLLKGFQKTSPKTRILVNSISTPTEDAIKDNSSIGHYKEFNEAIKQMCKDNNYTYIDISEILPSHPDLYAGDGIHADPSYYPVWMDKMIESAGM
jgi:hypothetical protein